MNTLKKHWVVIVLLISSAAILSALIAEYVFDILPCQMCLYQRYPYYFIILFSIIYIITKKIPLASYYWINSFAFAIGLFFSVWHIGIAQKIIDGNQRANETAVMTILNHLIMLQPEENELLQKYNKKQLFNHRKIHIGDVEGVLC